MLNVKQRGGAGGSIPDVKTTVAAKDTTGKDTIMSIHNAADQQQQQQAVIGVDETVAVERMLDYLEGQISTTSRRDRSSTTNANADRH